MKFCLHDSLAISCQGFITGMREAAESVDKLATILRRIRTHPTRRARRRSRHRPV